MAEMKDMSSQEEFQQRLVKIIASDNSSENVSESYKEWATKYDKDMTSHGYGLPQLSAGTLANIIGDEKELRILDMGAGTGMVGKELKNRGFTNIDALDASAEMLEVARGKGIYQKFICDSMGAKQLDIGDDTYDAVVAAGVFIPNHMNDSCFEEVIRICKPGGYIVFSLVQRHLYEPDFKGRFESRIMHLEETSAWKWVERKLHEDIIKIYSQEKRNSNGISYVMQKEY